jgi:hypothetical protein
MTARPRSTPRQNPRQNPQQNPKHKLGLLSGAIAIGCLFAGYSPKTGVFPNQLPDSQDAPWIDRTASLVCLPSCAPRHTPRQNLAHNPGLGDNETVLATAASLTPDLSPQESKHLFAGDSQSLVARAVGSAEGTRRPDGGKNHAYYGHVDPGNRAWNLGSFSYQHGAKNPEEADRKQLRRLKLQFQVINSQAQRLNLNLTPAEQLNAIDLANQAPLAALSEHGGFIERLLEARRQGLSGNDAILQARVNAYRNPDTNLWEAPGLGNTEDSIRRDQARRQEAIAMAMARP